MSAQTAEELEMARLLVEALNFEGKPAESIQPDAPLFGQAANSLGLDSIDALEIALAIQQNYGVELRSEDEEARKSFASLRALTNFVQSRRAN